MTTVEIQKALIRAGISLGSWGADGVWGRASIAGMKEFQKRKGLPETGIADAATLKAMFPAVKIMGSGVPPWHEEILRLRGTAEIKGKKNSAVIMGWAERLGIWYPNDETAWCGLLIGHVMGLILPTEVLPGNVLGARQWERFGVPLKEPSVGAVVTFWRGSPKSGFGHVGTYVAETAKAIRVAGGNQNNRVTDDTWISKDRLTSIRWPASYPLPNSGAVVASGKAGPLSTNEA